MGVTIAVAEFTDLTTTGNKNITTTDLGGLTPKAAIFILGASTSDGTRVNHANFCIGFTDGTNHRLVSSREEHGPANGAGENIGMTDQVIALLNNTTSAIDGEASFSAWITDGVTINVGNAFSSAFLGKVIFFAGSDVSAKCGAFTTPTTVDTATNVTGVGFEPDLVWCITHNTMVFNDTIINDGYVTFGFCENDGSTNPQAAMRWGGRSGAALADINAVRSNVRVSMQADKKADGNRAEVQLDNFDSDGFDAFARGDTTPAAVTSGYLALNFNAAAEVGVNFFDSPTSTGNATHTCGFIPQFSFILGCAIQTLDTLISTDDASYIGFSMNTETTQASVCATAEDGATNMNTQTLIDNQSMNFEADTGTAYHVATFVEFDATDGITLNYSTANGTARKFAMLSIEESASVRRAMTIT